MPRLFRHRLTMTTALAALLLPVSAAGVLAQSAGFAIEVGPSADGYTPVRVGARVFGPVTESAASFVRGCQGWVPAEGAGAVFDVTDTMMMLSFTGAGDGLRSLVLGTPDGLYRCALADDRGYVATDLANAQAGRYTVWLGADEGATLDARLIASDRPVSSIELFGLDLARLGEPRNGRHVFAATTESGRQELVLGATLYANTDMRALDANNCWGFGQLDAPDAVLTLDQASNAFSVFAMSDRDLVLAVVDPSGTVHCNDDVYQLNPGVTLEAAAAGDYHVFVGGFSEGEGSYFDLYASEGAPAFSNGQVDLNAPPRNGYLTFDPMVAGQGQLLASAQVAALDPVEMLPIGYYCAGFTDLAGPDVVLTLTESQPMMSLYAVSQSDLTLAVRAPDGIWHCNDDAYNLNPGLSLTNAQPGDYMVWVGAYNPGDMGMYDLYASMGSPNWQGAGAGELLDGMQPQMPEQTMQAPVLNTIPEGALAFLDYGPAATVDPRLIFDVAPSTVEAYSLGNGCAGFITPERPDVVLNLEAGLPQVMVYIASDVDTTLVIQGPDGQLHCNDDYEMLNPGVLIPSPVAGPYAIFAGSYTGTGGPATLGVTIANPIWTMDREP